MHGCDGYARTDWPCRACCAENKRRTVGFVESDSLASDAAIAALREKLNRPDFPVTVTVHTLTGESFPVPNVREDSIGFETRKGVPFLVFERYGSDVIGYVPNVAYWVTDCE
jgi:hypothetical protein